MSPPHASTSAASTVRASLLGILFRGAMRTLLGLIILFCAALLTLRYFVLPDIDRYRERIAGMLQSQIGQPVEIGGLRADWDGWNPRLDVDDLHVLDGANRSVILALPRSHLTVAWTSLLFLDLRLKELAIEGLRLTVRRDAQGMLHLAGLTFDPTQEDYEMAPAAWLLRQRRIRVHDATVVWQDQRREAPELTLEHVEFRLESTFGRHRFGLTGAPPAQISSPIDVRGELNASSLFDWRAVSGRLYARLDYADVAAWRQWLSLPMPIASGKGALRLWFDFSQGEPRELVADVVLADVKARLAPALPELVLERLEGRVGWRGSGTQTEYFTRQLSFTGPGGVRLEPTDFDLTLRHAANGDTNGGRMQFNYLQLQPLTQLAAQLPLPQAWREQLAGYAPRGKLEQVLLAWQGDIAALDNFTAEGRFIDLGVTAREALPGIAGLSGSFEATERGGTLSLQSRGVTLAMPRVFEQPLALDTLHGQVAWTREGGDYALSIDQLVFANAHAAGTANGTYRTAPDGPGMIDLKAQLSRADVAQLYRYLPITLPVAVREWVRRSLLGGTATETRLRLAGNLAEFPFANGKGGQFLVATRARGVTFDYAEHWPAFSDVEGEFRMDGARVSIDANGGRVLSFGLKQARARIADVRADVPLLQIEGEGAGPTADLLRYIDDSPIGEWIGNLTSGAQATGNGTLTLKLELPLGQPHSSKASGEYSFESNRLELAEGVPAINKLSGTLAFTNHDVHARQLSGELLGGTARFSVETRDEQVRILGQGAADLAQLRVQYPEDVMTRHLSGTTGWEAQVLVRPEVSTWVVESNLKGAVIDLPAPLAKTAGDIVPLQVERRANESGRDSLEIRYGSIARLTLLRRWEGGKPTLDRGLLALGGAQGEPDRPGLWIRGKLDALNIDGWLALRREAEASELGEPLEINGIDLGVHTLDVFGRRLNELQVIATHAPGEWQMVLRARELAGGARWRGAAPARPNGEISARLQRLTTPSATPAAPGQVSEAPVSRAESSNAPNSWPKIDIVADSFIAKSRDLGKLELTAQPRGTDWQIERLQLSSDEGKLVADGWWRVAGPKEQTKLDATLDITDAGKYLARFGLPGAIRGASTKVQGSVTWDGPPQAFDYPTLSGTFRIEAGPGQFLKLDPGPAKLLGMLSLQSLRRRLSFDYQDLFGEGFAFDEITGDVRIQNGVMSSDNVRIVGPAASVEIRGETNLAHETQRLRVHVQPKLSSSVSVGAAALWLANPIIGAAVGAGTLLAQKIMSDPIEQVFSNDYVITGTWSDPTVERAARSTKSGDADGSAERSVR
jgi:uncharacterized protein (TIGR02099 family)